MYHEYDRMHQRSYKMPSNDSNQHNNTSNSTEKLNISELEASMKNAIAHLVKKFDSLRSSRVSQSFLDNIEIDQHGSKMLLKHIALVGILDHSSLEIDLFDPSMTSSVKQAIREKLQLEAVEMGKKLKLTVPPMTEERRKSLCKQAAEYAEDERIVLRNLRRHSMDIVKNMKKIDNISEDEEKRHHKDIDKVYDHYHKEIDELLKIKEKAILGH